MIALVLGGARSGKSEVAERMVALHGPSVTYVATATVDPADPDMARRVEEHRSRRPGGWTTVEAGSDMPAVLATLAGPVLVDSLGTWVAGVEDPDPQELAATLTAALGRRRSGATVLVSEEVGMGIHPPTEVGRRFRDVLGAVNQAVAAAADEVLLVVAGRVLPLGVAPGP